MKPKPPLVIYRNPCRDGFTAAWIAHRYFVEKAIETHQAGEVAEFRPAKYGDAPPTLEEVEDRTVYILDFSYTAEEIAALGKVARVVVLDHHKTAEAELEKLSGIYPYRDAEVDVEADTIPPENHVVTVFNMEKCGARLALEWFYPNESFRSAQFARASFLVDYIEDRDLWTWELPFSREISAYVASRHQTFGDWDDLSFFLSMNFEEVVSIGETLLRAQALEVQSAIKNVAMVRLAGFAVPAVNSCVLQSEIGNELLKEGETPWGGKYRAPFAVVWWFNGTAYQYSLRGHDGGPDVSEIAKMFGGGGHRNAAGFESKYSIMDSKWFPECG